MQISLPESLGSIILILIAAVVVGFLLKTVLKIAIAFISGAIIALIVYFLFNNLLWAAVAFVIVALISLFRR